MSQMRQIWKKLLGFILDLHSCLLVCGYDCKKKKQCNSITRHVCRLFNQLVCTSFSHTLPFQRYWANLFLTVYLLSHHSVCAQPHMTWVANWQRNKPCFPINLHFTHFPLFLSVNFFPTFLASHWAILNKHLLSYVLPSDPHIGS